MLPAQGSNRELNLISKYLPCLEELLFLKVFAQPKDSNNGFVAKTISLIFPMDSECVDDAAAMYCIILFAASVLPAPDSPEIITHWFSLYAFKL